MGQISSVLRNVAGGGLSYWCPGCDQVHSITVGENGWEWNGDVEHPTFSPSVDVSSGHYSSLYKPGDDCWCTYNAKHPDKEPAFKCKKCHTFIQDGVIEFLTDCTHHLAGQKVPMVKLTEVGMADD